MRQRIYNRKAATIAKDVVIQTKNTINDISGSFPFLVGILGSERRKIAKINVSNKVFVEDAINIGKKHQEDLPRYLSMEELEHRLNTFIALDELISVVAELHAKLRDTQAQIGGEAYAGALSLYNYMKQAYKDGMPGMEANVQLLGERFKGQRNNAKHGKGDKS